MKNTESRQYSDEVKAAHRRIIKLFEDFDPEGITVLTGNNGSGKSLLRKQLPFAFQQYYEFDNVKDTKDMILSTSMDARTGSNPEWGALSGAMNDTSWIATSQNTYHAIKSLLDTVEKNDVVRFKRYIVIDEYEIGCSEETIVALASYISKRLRKLLADGKIIGAMIITHSKTGLKEIEHEVFANVEGLTESEWLNRKIVPTDLDKLDANELFFYIRDFKE